MMNATVERLAGWPGSRPGPVRLQINPTERCNLHCRFCWQQDTERVSYDNEISDQRYAAIIDEAADMGVKEVTVTGGGEPLCRKEAFLKIMRQIKGHGMRGTLITNGTLLQETDAVAMIESGWDEVIFSLDSPDRETHEYLRNDRGCFDKTVGAIRQFSLLKGRSGMAVPKICIHYVVCNRNHAQIVEMVQLAHTIGAANIFFEPIVNVSVFTDLGKRLKMTKDEQAEFQRLRPKAAALCDRLGLEYNLADLSCEVVDKTNEMDKVIEGDLKQQDGGGLLSAACYEPFHNMVIRPNGRAGPCCMFDESGEYVHDKSLADIWQGRHFNLVRERLLRGELLDYCRQCNPGTVASNRQIRGMLRNAVRNNQ
ncbi:MAG: radical SAM protein [archaeon]